MIFLKTGKSDMLPGSSISGTDGGFFYNAWGWSGVVLLILLLIGVAGIAIMRLAVLAPGGRACNSLLETGRM